MPMQLPTRRYGGDSEESVDEGASGVDRKGPLASLILRGRPEGHGPLSRPSAIPFCKPMSQTPHAHHLLLNKPRGTAAAWMAQRESPCHSPHVLVPAAIGIGQCSRPCHQFEQRNMHLCMSICFS